MAAAAARAAAAAAAERPSAPHRARCGGAGACCGRPGGLDCACGRAGAAGGGAWRGPFEFSAGRAACGAAAGCNLARPSTSVACRFFPVSRSLPDRVSGVWSAHAPCVTLPRPWDLRVQRVINAALYAVVPSPCRRPWEAAQIAARQRAAWARAWGERSAHPRLSDDLIAEARRPRPGRPSSPFRASPPAVDQGFKTTKSA